MPVTRVFSGRPASARQVRAFVRGVLRHSDQAEIFVLLASELAANAVQYGQGDFEVSITPRPDRTVKVSVADNSKQLPSLTKATIDATRGRGLHLVDDLSLAWGVEPTDNGKVVWFVAPD